MADDTHYFNITFRRKYYEKDGQDHYEVDAEGNRTVDVNVGEEGERSLTVTKSESQIYIPSGATTSFTCKAYLVYTTFNRKVYQPNEIVADICFNDSKVQDFLSFFFNAEVDLIRYSNDGEQETYSGFYVYDALPLKKPNTDLYIRFHIYSLDHQLTLKKYSRTYVAKKLVTDILLAKIDAKKTNDENLEINDFHALREVAKTVFEKDSKQTFSEMKFQKFPITVAPYTDQTPTKDDNGKDNPPPSLDRIYSKYIKISRDENGKAEKKDNKVVEKELFSEYIQPYLVQYNESFYDFMVRTANRCGEFFFWDGNMLRLGRSCTDGAAFDGSNCTVYYKNTNTEAKDNSYKTEFFSLDNLNRKKDFESDISSDDDIKNNIDPGYGDGEYQYLCFGNDKGDLKPDLSTHAHYYNNEVNQDVYRTRLYRDRFDSLYQETVGNAIKYGVSFVSKLLNETSMYDFLKKFTVSNVLMTGAAAAQWGQANKFGNNHHLDDWRLDKEKEVVRMNFEERHVRNNDGELVYGNLFINADTGAQLTNAEFYNDIRQKEEYLSCQTITFNTVTPQLVRLGQTFEYNSKYYVIVQIKMKLGTNESKFSDIDATAEAEFKDLSDAMQVVAIPTHMIFDDQGKVSSYSVYPPMHPAGHVRRSEPQVAVVADYLDPQQRGRVRIKYPWQSKSDTEASPWIRVLTPSATPDSGCTFELEEGDEVLVEYESDNIERPYVAGTLYNKFNHAPFTRGDMALISKNGHGIAFDDPIDWSKFLAGIFPIYDFINGFLAIDTSEMKKSRRLTGGTTISDAYGFYKIEMSTDQRKIDIKSPFGTVNIDAFQGINICAPNGDINIKGQNINIEAGNAIKVTSGTNISKKYYWGNGTAKDIGVDFLTGVCGGLTDYLKTITQVVDLDLLRKVIQTFLRPIDGTLEIKSNQYLLLEAGHGEAVVQRDRYLRDKAPNPKDKGKGRLFSKQIAARNTANMGLRHAIYQIGVNTKAVIDDIPAKQKKIAKLKIAYDAAQQAAVNAGLIANGQHCPNSAEILTAVYHGGQPLQKDYVGNDNGDLHLKTFPQIAGGGAPPAADPDEGMWSRITKWIAEKLKQLKDALTRQQSTQQTELGRIEAEMNIHLQQLSNLAVNANALVEAAFPYFSYILDLMTQLRSKLEPITVNVNDENPQTAYYNELWLSSSAIEHINDIFTCLNGANDLQACALTDQQLADAKKYIMHQWFSTCLNRINRNHNNVVTIDQQQPYTFNSAPPCSDNWDDYVRGLKFGSVLDVSLGEKLLDPLSDIWMQYADFVTDIKDRDHWESGKPGQIIFSDQPQQSFYFDRNGVSQVYENEWTNEEASINKMKTMLNDLN